MHDRNGTELKVGDIVMVEAKVTDLQAGDEYCNATLSVGFEADHGPHNVTSTLTVNTKQTLLLKR